MKLDEMKFGLATGGAFAILWIVCSLLVYLLPGAMMSMSGDMAHSDFSGMGWHMGFWGLFIGLVAWTILAGITGWLIAFIYNRLL